MKLEYKKIYYPFSLSESCPSDIKEGDNLKAEQTITFSAVCPEIKKIPLKGKPLVSFGDLVEVGQFLYVYGKIKKTKYKSEIAGKVVEINKDVIRIEETASQDSNDLDKKSESPSVQIVPISGKVKKIIGKNLLIETEGLEINLVFSRGSSSVNEIIYIEDVEKFCAEPKPELVAEKTVITPKLNLEYYSTLSAFNAKSVITFQADFIQSQEITISSTAFGIIFGYGDLNIDTAIQKYFSQLKNKKCWVDTLYHRLIIFEDKKPVFLDGYTFDADKLLNQK